METEKSFDKYGAGAIRAMSQQPTSFVTRLEKENRQFRKIPVQDSTNIATQTSKSIQNESAVDIHLSSDPAKRKYAADIGSLNEQVSVFHELNLYVTTLKEAAAEKSPIKELQNLGQELIGRMEKLQNQCCTTSSRKLSELRGILLSDPVQLLEHSDDQGGLNLDDLKNLANQGLETIEEQLRENRQLHEFYSPDNNKLSEDLLQEADKLSASIRIEGERAISGQANQDSLIALDLLSTF